MTTEEAISHLKNMAAHSYPNEEYLIAIKALEQQPCEDCISRQEAISAIQDEYYANAVGIDIVDIIANLPSVQSTRPTGRWIDIQYFKNDDTYYRPKCPFCSIELKEYSNYCPNCGAKMTESEDKE